MLMKIKKTLIMNLSRKYLFSLEIDNKEWY